MQVAAQSNGVPSWAQLLLSRVQQLEQQLKAQQEQAQDSRGSGPAATAPEAPGTPNSKAASSNTSPSQDTARSASPLGTSRSYQSPAEPAQRGDEGAYRQQQSRGISEAEGPSLEERVAAVEANQEAVSGAPGVLYITACLAYLIH